MYEHTPPWHFENPLCAEVGTEIFYPPDKDDPTQAGLVDTSNEAKKICRSCEHIVECGIWGIANEAHGIWGGMSPKERQRQRTLRKIKMYNKIIHPYGKQN